jgi:hypothetical protein
MRNGPVNAWTTYKTKTKVSDNIQMMPTQDSNIAQWRSFLAQVLELAALFL